MTAIADYRPVNQPASPYQIGAQVLADNPGWRYIPFREPVREPTGEELAVYAERRESGAYDDISCLAEPRIILPVSAEVAALTDAALAAPEPDADPVPDADADLDEHMTTFLALHDAQPAEDADAA
jgi:hypothetical protein